MKNYYIGLAPWFFNRTIKLTPYRVHDKLARLFKGDFV